MSEENKVISAIEAGEFMHKLLPCRTAHQWYGWLSNNRQSGTVTGAKKRYNMPFIIPFDHIGKKACTYKTNDLMEAALKLEAAGLDKMNVRGPYVRKAKQQNDNDTTGKAEPANLRPGLEKALKIVRNLPDGVTAEQALVIALSMAE